MCWIKSLHFASYLFVLRSRRESINNSVLEVDKEAIREELSRTVIEVYVTRICSLEIFLLTLSLWFWADAAYRYVCLPTDNAVKAEGCTGCASQANMMAWSSSTFGFRNLRCFQKCPHVLSPCWRTLCALYWTSIYRLGNKDEAWHAT